MSPNGTTVGRRTTALVVDDVKTTSALQSLDRRLAALEDAPALRGRILKSVELPSGTTIEVYHGLGRVVSVFSAVQLDGAGSSGRIEIMETTEAGDPNPDRRNFALIRASGWSSTITLDLWVI